MEDAVRHHAATTGESLDSRGPEFPLRDTSRDTGDSGQGFPRSRDSRNRSEAWSEIADVVLPLPSSYVKDLVEQPSMSEPVIIERNLRQAAADHALEDVRTALIGVGYLQVEKKSKQRKMHTTRAQSKIQTAQREAERAADDYRRHRIALLALGMDVADPRYKVLTSGEVVPFSMVSDRTTVGQSRQRTSWIWENFVSTVTEDDGGNFKDFHEEGKTNLCRMSAMLTWAPSSSRSLVAIECDPHAVVRRSSASHRGDEAHCSLLPLLSLSMGNDHAERGRSWQLGFSCICAQVHFLSRSPSTC